MILTEQQVKDWASIDQDMRRRMQLFVDFAKLAESTHDTHYFVDSYEFFEPGVFVLDARSPQDPDGSQRQRKIKISAHRLLGEDDSIKESAELWYENVIGTEKIAFKRLVAATSIPHKLVNRATQVS